MTITDRVMITECDERRQARIIIIIITWALLAIIVMGGV